MKKLLSNLWYNITYPFVSIAVLIDESKRENLDGSWDNYWARKNARAARKERK